MNNRILKALATLSFLSAGSVFASSMPPGMVDSLPISASPVAKADCGARPVAGTYACVDGQWVKAQSGVDFAFNVRLLRHVHGGARSVQGEVMLHGAGGVPISYFSGQVQSYLVSVTNRRVAEERSADQANDEAGDSAFAEKAAALASADAASTSDTAVQPCAEPSISTELTLGNVRSGDDLTITPLAVLEDGSVVARVAFHEMKLNAMRDFPSGPDMTGLPVQLPEVAVNGGESTVRIPRNKPFVVPFENVDLEIRAAAIPTLIGGGK